MRMESSSLDKFKDLKETAQEVDRSKKLRIAIVGTGWIAEAHIKNYLKMEDAEIVAACDIVPGKAEKFLKTFGVEGANVYLSDKEMYEKENLDAVSICTYNKTHAEADVRNDRRGC